MHQTGPAFSWTAAGARDAGARWVPFSASAAASAPDSTAASSAAATLPWRWVRTSATMPISPPAGCAQPARKQTRKWVLGERAARDYLWKPCAHHPPGSSAAELTSQCAGGSPASRATAAHTAPAFVANAAMLLSPVRFIASVTAPTSGCMVAVSSAAIDRLAAQTDGRRALKLLPLRLRKYCSRQGSGSLALMPLLAGGGAGDAIVQVISRARHEMARWPRIAY